MAITIPNGPTGQVIMKLTMEENGRITPGACVEGPKSCGIKIYEIPARGETKLSLQFAKRQPPLWWKPLHYRLAQRWMTDNQVRIMVAYKNRQTFVKPSGYLEK